MSKITNFLAGIKVLEEVNSKFNGKITVIKSLAFGIYFQVGGLTQSGGIIKEIWDKPLKKISKDKVLPKNPKVLILGLGGGSIVNVLRKYWIDAPITAVDIDPVIVDLGKKYLGLDSKSTKIKISDAFKYINETVKEKKKYDLILVDLYRGDEFPQKFESNDYLKIIKKALEDKGMVVFNRLYYGEKRPQSVRFGNSLEKLYKKVDWVYPHANIMFVCNL